MLIVESKKFLVVDRVYIIDLSNGKTLICRYHGKDCDDGLLFFRPKILKKNGTMENYPQLSDNSIVKIGQYCLIAPADSEVISVYEQYIERY